MVRSLGKLMQIVGMVILPLAMVMQLTSGMRAPTGGVTVSVMLILMVFGAALFGLGRLIEAYAR